MQAVPLVMASVVVLVCAAFATLLIRGAREEEKSVPGFSRIDRSVGAKLELLVAVLKEILPTASVLIIVLTLVVALAGMSILTDAVETRGTFTVPSIKVSWGNITMIKLVKAVPVDEAIGFVGALLHNVTGSHSIVGAYLVKVADEPIRVEGVRSPKLVVIGFDNCCDSKYAISCGALDSPSPPFFCVDENELRNYLYVNGSLPLMPIQAFIGNEPVLPPPNSVVVASLDSASRLLGYEEAVANVVLVRGYAPPSVIGGSLGALVSEAWIVGGDGALVLTSEPVSTLEEVALAVFLSIAIAVAVSGAVHSMIPHVEEVASKLLISGFPSWGSTVIYYTAVLVLLTSALVAYSMIAAVAGLPTGVGHLVLVSAFLLTSLTRTPRTGNHVKLSEAVEDSLYVKIKGCDINGVIEDVVSAIRRTEFFVSEELTIKRGADKVFIRSRSIFSETWGIGVDVEVLISSLGESSCSVEVRASDWSIEEISASMTKSVRSLALSRIRSVIELWGLVHSSSH